MDREALDAHRAASFLREQFEYELCSDCGGDEKDHIVIVDAFGNLHAQCQR